MPGSSWRVKLCGWSSFSTQSDAWVLFYLRIHMQLISPAVLVCWNLMSSPRRGLEAGSRRKVQTRLCAQTFLTVRGRLLGTASFSEFSSSVLSNEQRQRNDLLFWSNCSSSLMQSNLAVILLEHIRGFYSTVIKSRNRPPLGFRREKYIFNGARWLRKRLLIDYYFGWVIPS